MTPNHIETLSSFFDGEAVDADVLADALAQTEAIDFLVDSARFRRAVAQDASRPSDEFREAMREKLTHSESRRTTRRRIVEMALAASLALAAAAGGFGFRTLLEKAAPAPSVRPGTTARSGPATGGPRRETTSAPATAPIPSPNLRIRFDEWHDRVL
jgi:hypothetical protein